MIRLRCAEPDLVRPFRARPGGPHPAASSCRCRRSSARRSTAAVWVMAMITHPGARYAGPAWLVVGLAVYLLVRIRPEQGLLEDIDPIARAPAGADFRRSSCR